VCVVEQEFTFKQVVIIGGGDCGESRNARRDEEAVAIIASRSVELCAAV
jgi:hypothetical protein